MAGMDVCVPPATRRAPSTRSDAPVASTSTLTRSLPAAVASDRAKELNSHFVLQRKTPLQPDMLPQYSNLYYMRLFQLKPRVVERAQRKWRHREGYSGPEPKQVDRVLDVQQGELSFIVGTVYMEMQLKPNVLDDLAKEHRLVSAPPPDKMTRPDSDQIMLEDASGRVRLTGELIKGRRFHITTGVIAGVLGAETKAGDFEVVDICFAGLPPQMSLPNGDSPGKGKAPARDEDDGHWIAIASGLELGGGLDADDARVEMLVEWLLGELGGETDQRRAARVSKLILAGNSMKQPAKIVETAAIEDKKPKKYGYDSSNFSTKPTEAMNALLAPILPSIDVSILPGDRDPTLMTLPQQALHPALFRDAGAGSDALETLTNPAWLEHDGALLLGSGGQPLDDVFRYQPTDDRLGMACSFLEWSHMAPTAPDTLSCHPFRESDPFVIETACPHIVFIGNQPRFETRILEGAEGQRVRVVLVPRFSVSGEIALVNTRTLACQVVSFAAPDVY